MVRISRALQRIKGNLDTLLSETYLVDLARSLGLQWRERCLSPAVTIQLLILQVLHGNVCCAHAPRLGGRKVSGAGYCQARKRLSLELLRTLVRRVAGRFQKIADENGRWHGHRTFLIDGSSCSMPDTAELRREFGQPRSTRRSDRSPLKDDQDDGHPHGKVMEGVCRNRRH